MFMNIFYLGYSGFLVSRVIGTLSNHVGVTRVVSPGVFVMRVQKVREVRPGLFARLFRVVWVVSLTGTALVGGVYWVGKSHCPDPCRIDGPQVAAQQPVPPQAVMRTPKTVR